MEKQILVARSSIPDINEYMAEIEPIFESAWLTNMGVKHKTLEKKLCEYCNVPYVSLISNGHMALELIIQAYDLKGEIITTPYTFVSTTHAIVRNGLTPVFCDIKDDYTIDPEKIEALITEKTTAIMPVHVYGTICDVEAIDKIAKKYNLKVIYDAAHSFGETKDKISVANFGDASVFSFHATKVFNTVEGGAVVCSDEKIWNKLYKLKNFGIEDEVIVDDVGTNAKMSEFHAAMGLCNLRHIDEEINKRKILAEKYYENLIGIKGLKLKTNQLNVKSNYAYFPIIFDENEFGSSRDEIYDRLKENNIYARKYFYPIITEFDCYKDLYSSNKTPIAKELSEMVLTLPLFSDLTLDDVDNICKVILKNYTHNITMNERNLL